MAVIVLMLMSFSLFGCKTLESMSVNTSVRYVEPTTYVNGAVLNDLDKTTVYYYIGSRLVDKKDVAASGVSGGSSVRVDKVMKASDIASGVFRVEVSATTKSGLESDKVVKTVSRKDIGM